ncbi:hypothetical protein UCREL1_6320 [Eutypa lata UCREL1]|uniref:Clavaminate synthase-like protein n=1 Tax=Eutypa lata (strain UCR-EL1) TaxID=1287681 RepID=M7SK27_EUTLA|nr:hypothetical protein UCREL1_6320 [Eutypa lata UCREL1]
MSTETQTVVSSETPKALNQDYKHLTPEDVEHFLTKGWLRVPGAIKEEYIDKWMKDLWTRVDYDEHDKSTWHTEYLHLPRHREVPAEEFAPEAWNKIIEICGGEDRIDPVRERYYGDAFIVNFGTKDRTTQDKEASPQDMDGWHTDDDWYRMFLDSSGNALTVIHVFTDIPPRGGGTWVCEDGLEGVVKYLPYVLNRSDGNYSLLEQVILRNLGRESLPEFKTTRGRKFWYPRNAGFKRAKAEAELQRMLAAAKAKGLDESSVDSIYLRRGTKEFEEFERHNGFDKEVNVENGLLMEQHKLL